LRRSVHLVLLLGALAASAALRPEYGGTLRLAAFEPPVLDPAQLPLPTDGALTRLVYETLLVPGPGGALERGLAEDWTLSPDGLRLSLTLREARFADGEALTPAAVIASLARLRGTPQGWLVEGLELPQPPGASEHEGSQLRLQLRHADPLLPYKLAHPAAGIVHRGADGLLYGTGPFTPAAGQSERGRLLLGPNRLHRDGAPYLDSVEVTLFETADEALRELERGGLDLSAVPMDDADRLAQGLPYLRLHRLEHAETVALVLSPRRLDPAYKAWIASHLDLGSMIAYRLRGHGGRARTFDARLTPYASGPAPEPGAAARPAGLRPLRLAFPRHLPLAHQLAARIRGDLQTHGAQILLEPLGRPLLARRLTDGDYDLALVFVRSLGSPPLTLLDWAQTLRLAVPQMDTQLASWLRADEALQALPWVLPLFWVHVHHGAQSRLVDLHWNAAGRPLLEQTWWKPRLDFLPR
jgi:MarR-like DNA-binding transcriptional regulator SgrR of sgrS sRNA